METLISDRPATLMRPAAAAELAQHLTSEDGEGWTYRTESRGAWSVVVVHDETGTRLGPL